MGVYRCMEPSCKQPIPREMAVLTSAGGYTGGYCQKDAQRRSGAENMFDPNEGLNQSEAAEQTAAPEATTEAEGQAAAVEPEADELAIEAAGDDSK